MCYYSDVTMVFPVTCMSEYSCASHSVHFLLVIVDSGP